MPSPTLQDLGFAKEVNLNLIVQDLSLVATTAVDGGVKIWNAETGDCMQTLGKTLGNGQYQGVRCLRFRKHKGRFRCSRLAENCMLVPLWALPCDMKAS